MIKKYLPLSTIILILLFSGCNKDNEDLIRGKWQLRHIDMPNNSQISTDSVFYSFQLNIFELATLVRGNDFSAEKANGIYSIKTDSIFMTITPSFMGTALKSPYYGWHTAEKDFAILKLNHSALILSCNDTIYTFRKF